ncbi:META domain-containing protein [Chloroflexota bacterium]
MKTKYIMALVIIAVVITTGACSSLQGTDGLENKKWKLKFYGEEGKLQEVLGGTEITTTFDGAKDQVRGSAGANTYSGSYRINGNRLSILELSWTEMYRMDPPGVMEQEAEYLKLFKAAESFVIQNGTLQITSGKLTLIYYEENSGILQGIVTIGPITPVERPGEKPPIPPEVFEARKIMVYDKSGKTLIQQVDIDSEGQWYVAHLKPGTYTIDINRIGMDSSDDVPQQLEIQLGITTRLDIDIDTGIR